MNLFRLKDGNLTKQRFKERALLLVALVLACFALPQRVQATDLDGVLPGGNNADGYGVLTNLTTGGYNTGSGWFSLHTNTQGNNNTAFGAATLFSNTGYENTATGAAALFSNTTAAGNTAIGAFALFSNTEGESNTATGAFALFNNTHGDANTAVGGGALEFNDEGESNTAVGNAALISNTFGSNNTALGVSALHDNISGGLNTALGLSTLRNNSTGSSNTAIGYAALLLNTTGSNNTALGALAGSGVTTANNVICIGADVGGANVSNSCFIGSIYGQMAGFGTPVYINSSGQLGTTNSAHRFKDDIKPMDKASEVLFSLKPVTFRYKKELDLPRILQFGLVAEDVEKVNPDLVVRDADGKVRTVRYEQINAMLLNEFLKEHRKVEKLEGTVAQQRKDFQTAIAHEREEMQAAVAQLNERIQKVSAQLAAASPSRGGLEASKFATGRIRRGGPALQVVNNP